MQRRPGTQHHPDAPPERADGPAGEQELRPPDADRHHRRTGEGGQPGDAALGGHLREIGVAGGGALRIDHHGGALAHRLHRVDERLPGVAGLPVDGDLAGVPQDEAEPPLLVQLGLGQEAGLASGRIDERAEAQRVEIGDVVGRHDHRAFAWNVEQALAVQSHPETDHRRHNGFCQGVQGLSTALHVAAIVQCSPCLHPWFP